jgi:hypothetical protein
MKVLIETKELSDTIIDIIQSAKEKLWLVTPYIQLTSSEQGEWHELLDALRGAQNRGIEIQNIFRKNQNKDPTKEFKDNLQENRVSYYLINDLHAKIYCNESQALITSMNLFAHSYVANYEIGIYITKDDAINFGRISTYIEKLKRKGVLPPKQDESEITKEDQSKEKIKKEKLYNWIKDHLTKKNKMVPIIKLIDIFPDISKFDIIQYLIEYAKANTHYSYIQDDEMFEFIENIGYCILCKRTIEYDSIRHTVRCPTCYEIGIRSGKYCHKCGVEDNTYPNAPYCKKCSMEEEKKASSNKINNSESAFCITCDASIPFDEELNVVRCKDCWKSNRYGPITGIKCHMCGKEYSSSLDYPVCKPCYKSHF